MLTNKLLLSFCLVLGLIPTLFAQNIESTIEWQKCFGSRGVEEPRAIITTDDGGYIFVALANPLNDGDLAGIPKFGINNDDIWVVKVAVNGQIQWQKLLGGTKSDIPVSIIQTTDGGYFILGVSNSNDGDVGCINNDSNVWMVKLSPTGTLEWQKCLGGSLDDTAYSCIKTADGGFIFVGNTKSNDGDVVGNNRHVDAWVVKLSSIGTIQWQKFLGGSGEDQLLSIYQTSDGGYVLGGATNSGDGDVSGVRGFQSAWIVKLSSLGGVQWQKCYGGGSIEIAYSVIQTLEGGYIFTGNASSTDGDVRGYHRSDFPTPDAWVVKLSSLGAIQWQKCLGGSQSEHARSIIQIPDSSYVIAGYSNSNDGDLIDAGRNAYDGWIVKLSSKGILQWQKALGGTKPDLLLSVIYTSDKGYLCFGLTFSNDFDVQGSHSEFGDVWLVKIFSSTKVLIGKVEQTNTSCQLSTPPQYVANSLVKIEKNNTINYVSTDSLGRFGIGLDTGRFIVSAFPPNQLWTACAPQVVTFTNPKISDTISLNPTVFANTICPLMEVHLTTSFLRRCFESQYTINYSNRGTATQNDATAELTLDSALTFVSATRPVRSRVGNKVIFSLGNVGINQKGQFDVTVKVSCDSRLGQTHCSSVIIPKTMSCDTVQDSLPAIVPQCVAGCDSISFLVNKPNTTLNKTFKYQLIADAALIDTGRFVLINTFNLKRKRDGRTLRLEVRNPTTNQLLVARSVESNPSGNTPSVSTGFVNQFDNAAKQANILENCTANRGAFDPNDKAAVPTGIGTAHLIEQGKEIEYLVQFQNTGTDTAFTVVVRDTLAKYFNLSTFKSNATSHVASWQLNPKGILTMTFNNINLVDSFTNEKKSHGFFKYAIKLNDSIATNTIVTNRAGIYFDFNAPIITNLTSHTIGKELLKNCLIKPTISVNYSGCPNRNIVFTATAKSAGLNPTYAWFRNNETTPLSINAVFTLNNAVKGTKVYCKTTASSDICTETPVITSDTIVLNCIGVPTTDLTSIVQLFDVFPNPNKGIFTIKLNTIKSEKIQLNILNYLGQIIKSELINSDNYTEEFNLSNLPNGIYLIKLTIHGQSLSRKISIQ
jgi:uncharacterized repeat protein (TIGR01451 family)